MSSHPKLLSGQVQIKGVGQLMADGSWSAYSVITEHLGSRTEEKKRLVDGSYATELEAVNAGLHRCMDWLNESFPIPD